MADSIFDLVRVKVALADTPLEPSPTFSDLRNVQSITTEEGFGLNSSGGTFPVGTATIVVANGDHAGRAPFFDPTTSYKGRQILIITDDDEELFRGRIDSTKYNYAGAPFAAFATLGCVSGLGVVKDGPLDPDDPPLSDEVDGYTNVASVAVAVENILAITAIPLGGTPLFSNQLVKAPDHLDNTQGLLELLQKVLESEGAAIAHHPDNTFRLRSRWEAFTLLDPDAPTPLLLTGEGPPYDTGVIPYLRNSLEWSDPDADFANTTTAGSAYLFAPPFTVGTPPEGWPPYTFTRSELPTIRQGWVEADARMWYAVKSKAGAFPAVLKVLIANPKGYIAGHDRPSGDVIGTVAHRVRLPVPGSATVLEFLCVVDGVKNEIDHRQWVRTYGYQSLDRWALAYPYDPLRLVMVDGDAEHGIDSGAIIAP